jgi:hypothetical protein
MLSHSVSQPASSTVSDITEANTTQPAPPAPPVNPFAAAEEVRIRAAAFSQLFPGRRS